MCYRAFDELVKVVVLSFLKGVGSAKASLVIQVGYACVFETLLLVILTDGIPVL